MKYAKWAMGLALAAVAQVPLHAQNEGNGNAQKGRETFVTAGCYQCHGRLAQGARGPTMANTQYPFAAFEVFVRQPVGGGMPIYTERMLPDQDLYDIYAYLKSLPGPVAPADMPALLKP